MVYIYSIEKKSSESVWTYTQKLHIILNKRYEDVQLLGGGGGDLPESLLKTYRTIRGVARTDI